MYYSSEEERHKGVAGLAAEHIRLSYLYLDQGDHDGYASLVDPSEMSHPSSPSGSPDPQGDVFSLYTGSGRHELLRFFCDQNSAVVFGEFVYEDGRRCQFLDFFVFSEVGLILSRSRFLPVS